MRYSLFVLYLCLQSSAFAQDAFINTGTYTPNYFAEILDAELYATDTIYTVGVSGFLFIDASDMSAPRLIGDYNTGSIFKRFYNGKAVGDLAIGAGRLDGIYFVSIADMSTPHLLRIYAEDGKAYESIDFIDTLAYAAAHDSGLQVFNIKDPRNPVSVSNIIGLTNTWDVFLHDNYLYVADGSAGLKIFSLQDPAQPELISALPTSGTAIEVLVENGYAYIALGAAGFDIIDVRQPGEPVFVSNFKSPFGIVNHLDHDNGIVFAATWELVLAVDVTDPFIPKLLATEDTPRRSMGLAAANGNVYVTDWPNVQFYTFAETNAPDIHIKPNIFDFGFPGLDIPSIKEFEIYNMGDVPLIIDSIKATDQRFQVHPDILTIQPGAKDVVSVTFSSPQIVTYLLQRLYFYSNDPDEIQKEIRVLAGRNSLDVGETAPDFVLPDLDGFEHSLSDYIGKIVILAFFASW